MNGGELGDETLEVLAKAIHGDYLRRQRARRGGDADPAPSQLRRWGELPETLQRSNRDQARDIAHKLAVIGYRLVPAGDPSARSLRLGDEQVELLAREEHARFVTDRIADGWQPGPERDVAQRRSPYLVGWELLAEDVRDLDRDAVRVIPRLLATAGLAVAPVS